MSYCALHFDCEQYSHKNGKHYFILRFNLVESHHQVKHKSDIHKGRSYIT